MGVNLYCTHYFCISDSFQQNSYFKTRFDMFAYWNPARICKTSSFASFSLSHDGVKESKSGTPALRHVGDSRPQYRESGWISWLKSLHQQSTTTTTSKSSNLVHYSSSCLFPLENESIFYFIIFSCHVNFNQSSIYCSSDGITW